MTRNASKAGVLPHWIENTGCEFDDIRCVETDLSPRNLYTQYRLRVLVWQEPGLWQLQRLDSRTNS
jgi:hypothetical protein